MTTTTLDRLLWPDADLAGFHAARELDLLAAVAPLTGADGLQETQLLELRVDAMRSRAGLLLDLRGGLSFPDEDVDVGLLVLDGLRVASWAPGPEPDDRTAWTVLGWRPERNADGFTLRCGFNPHADLLVRSVSAAFVVGVTAVAHDAPPDYIDDDEPTVREGTASWSTGIEPRAAVFWPPQGRREPDR